MRAAQPDRPTAWCWDLALAVAFWDAAVAHTGLSPRAQRAPGVAAWGVLTTFLTAPRAGAPQRVPWDNIGLQCGSSSKRPERLEVGLTVEATERQGDGACPARQRAGWEREPAAACEEQGWRLGPGAVDRGAARAGAAELAGAVASDAVGLERSAKDPVQEEGLQRDRGDLPSLLCAV